jgi:death-on-curing family protein
MNEIEIYQSGNNQIEIRVEFEKETVWLSQKQIATLFEKDTDTIGLHLKNIFSEEELDENSTTELLSVVQLEGNRNVKRQIKFYNLDAILSVGYRVNSKQGTQFRRWATQKLKDYLVKGAAINQKRLEQLQQTVELISEKINIEEIQEAKGLLDIIKNYTQSFLLLNQYDSHSLQTNNLNDKITYEIQYQEANEAISQLKKQLISSNEATELFGNQKDKSFQGILGNVIQSFAGQYLYPSIEEQAAHLLYFIIKNHPFSDGNKRIGAFMFIWFLDKNKHQFKKSGEIKINDNALVTLALLVAQSDPNDKELMIQLIINLINN